MPQAIHQETPAVVDIVTSEEGVSHQTGESTTPETSQEKQGYTAKRTHLCLSMQMTRQQLLAAWNAFKNLADLVGNIRLTIEVNKADGFDQSWLQNALYEPLDEANVDVHEE